MPDRSKKLLKTKEEVKEYVFKQLEFRRECIPALTKLLIEKHPKMYGSHDSFLVHIYNLCEQTSDKIFEEIWRIVIHNRQGKTPYDFPKLDFDDLKIYMKTYDPPVPYTAERFMDKPYFAEKTEKEKQEYVDEINKEKYDGWLNVENYIKQFTKVMQDILLVQVPEIFDIGGDWWVVYDYRFRMAHFGFSAWAYRIEHVIECGLTGEWLDKGYKELDEKMSEIHQKEWQEKYGNKIV